MPFGFILYCPRRIMKVSFIALDVILPLFFPFKEWVFVSLLLFVLFSIIYCILFFKITFFSLILVMEWDRNLTQELVLNLSGGL